jgi:LPS-assembly protein
LRASALALALTALSGVARADDNETVEPPAPALKPSPELTPPTLRPPAGTPAKPAAPSPAPGTVAPVSRAPFAAGEGAIFFRADEIQGIGNKEVTATGKVELRTRRETVLADWLHYDFVDDEIWAKGDVTLRQGIDWITGPEVRYKRTDETGFFIAPEFHVGENSSRGDASMLTFDGPNHYLVKDVRYTTCVAGNNDWYIRMGSRRPQRRRATMQRSSSWARRSLTCLGSSSRCRASASRDS